MGMRTRQGHFSIRVALSRSRLGACPGAFGRMSAIRRMAERRLAAQNALSVNSLLTDKQIGTWEMTLGRRLKLIRRSDACRKWTLVKIVAVECLQKPQGSPGYHRCARRAERKRCK